MNVPMVLDKHVLQEMVTFLSQNPVPADVDDEPEYITDLVFSLAQFLGTHHSDINDTHYLADGFGEHLLHRLDDQTAPQIDEIQNEWQEYLRQLHADQGTRP